MPPFRMFMLVMLLAGFDRVDSWARTPATTQPDDNRSTSTPTSRPAAESKDPRAQCAAHMRQMILAGLLWSNAHNLQQPPDLKAIFEELQEDIGLDPKMFLCPVDHTTKVPKNWSTMSKGDQIAWAVEHTSYTYSGTGIDPIKSIQLHLDDQIIVLTERIHDHTTRGGGMNVGFADGHVEFVTKAQLPEANARSDAARAKLPKGS